MAESIFTRLDGLDDPKQLKALARQALKKAEKTEVAEISPSDEKLAPIAKAILQANRELKLKSVETIALVMRRMKLGHTVVRGRYVPKSGEKDISASAVSALAASPKAGAAAPRKTSTKTSAP